jgi:ssDNA-binding Zn-finger/Zn-ribbon topoisomerase 1
MVLRESKKGKHVGRKFWGCSHFPTCRGVQLVESPQGDLNPRIAPTL